MRARAIGLLFLILPVACADTGSAPQGVTAAPAPDAPTSPASQVATAPGGAAAGAGAGQADARAANQVAASAVALPGVPVDDVVDGELGRDLDAMLAGLSDEGFAGAALVADSGTIYLKKGYGLADRDLRIPNNSETLFDVGGLARILTAAAILKLDDEGRLQVGDPVGRYLDALPDGKNGATLHQLLINTSGLISVDAHLDGASRAAFVDSIRASPAAHAPGAEFHLSAAGYSLLAAVVEETADLPFERYLQRALLLPAGMASTGFAWEERWQQRRVAVGYDGLAPGDLQPVDPPEDRWDHRGPGNIVTTVGDLYRFILALKYGTILSPASTREMFTAYIGTEGYSWHIIDDSTRGSLVRRGGEVSGFESSLRWYRDSDLMIIFTVNSNIGHRIAVARGIADVLEKHIPSPGKRHPGP